MQKDFGAKYVKGKNNEKKMKMEQKLQGLKEGPVAITCRESLIVPNWKTPCQYDILVYEIHINLRQAIFWNYQMHKRNKNMRMDD